MFKKIFCFIRKLLTGKEKIYDEDSYTTFYYLNDKLHREDGPAVSGPSIQEWYLHGKLHRQNGPAAFLFYGSEEWWINGERHRENGPAVIGPFNKKLYYQNNKLHRMDGPAVEYINGKLEWWIEGFQFKTKEEFELELLIRKLAGIK